MNEAESRRQSGRDQLQDSNKELTEVDAQIEATTTQLERLQMSDDLVPPLERLDEITDSLSHHGIDFRFLFQEIEFAKKLTQAEMNAVEAAIGLERLSTLIVAPEHVAKAREIVFEFKSGLRVLDAIPVAPASAGNSNGHQAISEFIICDHTRIQSHIQALFADIPLTEETIGEGELLSWFDRQGIHGEKGARRQSSLSEATWIGQRRRAEIRAKRESDLLGEIDGLNKDQQSIRDRLKRIESSLKLLDSSVSGIKSLNLPSELTVIWTQKESAHRQMGIVEEILSPLSVELTNLNTDLKSRKETTLQLEAQLKEVDTKKLRTEVDGLEQTKTSISKELGSLDEQTKNNRDHQTEIKQSIPALEEQLVLLETAFSEKRTRLLEVVPPEVSDLDHYVYSTKRGSRIKPENLETGQQSAIESESVLIEKLRGADGITQNRFATKFRFKLNDERGRIEIVDYRGGSLAEIMQERQQQEEEWNNSLDSKNRNLIQNVLAQDLTTRLNDDLLTLERTIRGLNAVLGDLQFGNDRFKLNYTPTQEHSSFIKLIQKQSVLDEAGQNELREHLENRQDTFTGEGEVPPFLDYRNWYNFSFEVKPSKSEESFSVGVGQGFWWSPSHAQLSALVCAGKLSIRSNEFQSPPVDDGRSLSRLEP